MGLVCSHRRRSWSGPGTCAPTVRTWRCWRSSGIRGMSGRRGWTRCSPTPAVWMCRCTSTRSTRSPRQSGCGAGWPAWKPGAATASSTPGCPTRTSTPPPKTPTTWLHGWPAGRPDCFGSGCIWPCTPTPKPRWGSRSPPVRALAASLLLDARPASWRQLAGWATCLPVGVDLLDTGRIMDTDAVAAGYPFSSPDLPPPDPASPRTAAGVLYGYNAASSGLVLWDRFAQDNYNAVVLARSGAGKSYLVKLELLRSLYRGIEAFVLDPEDEYLRLAAAVGGLVLDLGAPGVHLNPMDLPLYPDPDGVRTAPRCGRRCSCTPSLPVSLHTTHGGAATANAGVAAVNGPCSTPRSPPPIAAPGSPTTRRPGRGPAPLLADLRRHPAHRRPTTPPPTLHAVRSGHPPMLQRTAGAASAGSVAGGVGGAGCTRSPTAPIAGLLSGPTTPPRPVTW